MSVFSSPYLAQCVRSLELNELSWVARQSLSRRRRDLVARMMKGDILGRLDRLDMFKLVTVVRRLPLLDAHKSKWCTELQEDFPSLDSLIALAFVFLPSLEKLESNWSMDPVFIWHLLLKADSKKVDSSPSPFVLRNLTHLKVNSESPCGNSSEILPLFQMPALTHFFGSNWGPIRRHGWDDGAETQAEDLDSGRGLVASPLTHLELRSCNVDLYTLQTILKHCRSVRTFIFHRDWDPRIHVRLSGGSLTKALSPLWGTLQNMALSFEPGIYIHQEGEIYPLDFSQFSVLTKLNVDAGYLIHDPEDYEDCFSPYESESDEERTSLQDRLPGSLEVLCITGFSTPPQMQFLIDDCCRMLQRRSRFPRFRELAIEAPFEDSEIVFDTKALQQEALRADVLFRKIDMTDHENEEYQLLTSEGCDWGMNGEFRWGTKVF